MVLVRKQTQAKSASHCLTVVTAQEQGFEIRFLCVYRADSLPSSTMS